MFTVSEPKGQVVGGAIETAVEAFGVAIHVVARGTGDLEFGIRLFSDHTKVRMAVLDANGKLVAKVEETR